MQRNHKIASFTLWGVLIVALIGLSIGALWRPWRGGAQQAQAGSAIVWTSPDQHHAGPSELFAVPELSLIDQDGNKFSTGELRGHPWIADFIFTTCPSLCPIMSHKMAELQASTPADVKLVSFTVDPQRDRPPVLRQYGKALNADFSRWHFLTGTPKEMSDAAYAMKISVKPASGPDSIVHSDKFLLVNGAGKVVGIYDGTDPDDVKRLAADASRLASATARGKPS